MNENLEILDYSQLKVHKQPTQIISYLDGKNKSGFEISIFIKKIIE